MCWWILSQDMIAKSFEVTDICNKMDRSENETCGIGPAEIATKRMQLIMKKTR
jgi:hypothetical protein